MRRTEPSARPAQDLPDPHARREALCRRLAERGIRVQVPARGAWQPPAVPFPVSADEASEAVIRMRRGDP